MRKLPVSSYFYTLKGLFKNLVKKDAIYPFYASFKITSRCHFGCPFCNMKKDMTKDLSTGDIKTVLDNLSRSSVLLTSFEGGEPLLREDIGELLRYARTCRFYLLFTTSARNILEYPIEEYSRYIDYLHVSIDEGHDNLEMYDLLPELVKLPTQISVQVVVTEDSLNALDWKVEKCYNNFTNIVIIPATPMEGARHCFPDISILEKKIAHLRKMFPDTIHTPQGYFKSYHRGECSSASIIIASDGRIYYPCHILEQKGPDLVQTDLTSWLTSKEAHLSRQKMKACKRNCGWYQYYAISSYITPATVYESLRPMLRQSILKRKNIVP